MECVSKCTLYITQCKMQRSLAFLAVRRIAFYSKHNLSHSGTSCHLFSLLYSSDNNAGICVGFASQFLCFFVTFCKKLSIVSLFLVLIIFPFQHHNKNQNQCVHSSYDPKIESIPNRNRFCCGDDRSRGIGIVGTASRLT